MAAPHVAGAAALLLERFPGWTPAQTKAALMQSAADLHFDAFEQGAGRLDVYAASTFPVVPSTGVFNYGLDDLTGPSFGSAETLTLTNTTTSTQTCSFSIAGALPTGITAGLSANSLTIPPGESRTVDFSLNIDNNIAPHSNTAPYDYSALGHRHRRPAARVPFVAVSAGSPLSISATLPVRLIRDCSSWCITNPMRRASGCTGTP
jgi:subtilisin family serine protease